MSLMRQDIARRVGRTMQKRRSATATPFAAARD
jgi:hypothetical protein